MVSAGQGARHLDLDYIHLPEHQHLSHTANSAEEVFVVINGSAAMQANEESHPLVRYGVLFLRQGDRFLLHTEGEPVALVRCYSLVRDDY